jgi:hypothetical protein
LRTQTLAQMILTVRQRTEIGFDPTQGNITDEELRGYFNSSIAELRGILYGKHGADYFKTYFQFPIVSGQDVYALPWDFRYLQGVDYSQDAQGSQWFPMQPYQNAQRNMYSSGIPPALSGTLISRYHVEKSEPISTIKFIPSPQIAIQLVKVNYTPQCPFLVAGTQADAFIASTTIGCGVLYQAILSGPGGNLLSVAHSAPAGTVTTVTVVGNTITVNPKLGETNLGVVAAVLGTSAAVLLLKASPVGPNDAVVTAATTLLGTLGGTIGAGSTGITDFDGFNGWEEYPIVDVSIKCRDKQQYDVRSLQMAKQALIDRINFEAENRDAGAPMVVVDTQGMDLGGGYPAGLWNGYGG